jgi:hypothetical protein
MGAMTNQRDPTTLKELRRDCIAAAAVIVAVTIGAGVVNWALAVLH